MDRVWIVFCHRGEKISSPDEIRMKRFTKQCTFFFFYIVICTNCDSCNPQKHQIITKSRRRIRVSWKVIVRFTGACIRSLEFQKRGTSARYGNNSKPPNILHPPYFTIIFYIVIENRYRKQFEKTISRISNGLEIVN